MTPVTIERSWSGADNKGALPHDDEATRSIRGNVESSGDVMSVLAIVGATGLGAGAWIAAPFVSMARRGTLDEQTRATVSAEGRRTEAVSRARRQTVVAHVPAPRSGAHEQRRSPVAA